jgi:hypothetical protein
MQTEELVMVTLSMGNKKRTFRSIREASMAAGIDYMTFYMRLRSGTPVKRAMKRPVRKYNKKYV